MLKATVIQKYLLAATGIFLCLFLVVHLTANLQLLLPQEEARLAYNNFAHLLEEFFLTDLLSAFLVGSIVAHAIVALFITLRNKKASPKYYYQDSKATSPWYATNMGVLGTLVLIFIIIHIRDFLWIFKFTDTAGTDANGHRDLYEIVERAFDSLAYLIFYVVSVIALGFHLLQGFFSAFKSLGFYQTKYYPFLISLGRWYAGIVTFGFVLVSVVMYLR